MAYKLLLIDDDEQEARYLCSRLAASGEFQTKYELTAEDGLKAFKEQEYSLVIAKYPNLDRQDFSLIKSLKEIDREGVIIVIFEIDYESAISYLESLGVYGYISKPFDFDKLLFLVKKGVELHNLIVGQRRYALIMQEQLSTLQKQNALLARRIEESTKNLSQLYANLQESYMRTVRVLAQAIDARDHYTRSHSENVSRIAVEIAKQMHLPVKEIDAIREACVLHDLGKIGIQDSILNKPATLDESEWREIKKHPLIAVQILEPLTFLHNEIELVRQHHENYDGSGYPEGRKGEDILLGARIIHLADAYESMRSPRSYRAIPLSKEEAIEEIKKNSGIQFDPLVVEAFLRVVDRLEQW